MKGFTATRSLTARDGSTGKVGTLSPQSGLNATEIINRLSYSHFEELTALAGMNNRLFVSKYQLALPKKKEIERFMEEQLVSETADVARSNRSARAVVARRRMSQGSVTNRSRTR